MTFSLIICSRKYSITKELELNIQETIQEDYELIVVDNSNNKLSIFEAYNNGLEKSQGEFVVFLHDDILFRTFAWGGIVKEVFTKNKDLGLLGIAGSTIKTRIPTTWWTGPGSNHIRILQHYGEGLGPLDRNEGFENGSIVEVAVIDGVLMIMRNDQRIKFNEKLNGFHNYDLDLSLQHINIGKKVAVTDKFLIEHFSSGKIDKQWLISSSSFHIMNFEKLPVIIQPVPLERFRQMEFTAGAEYVMKLLENDLRKAAFFWWKKLFKIKILALFHFKFWKEFLKKS